MSLFEKAQPHPDIVPSAARDAAGDRAQRMDGRAPAPEMRSSRIRSLSAGTRSGLTTALVVVAQVIADLLAIALSIYAAGMIAWFFETAFLHFQYSFHAPASFMRHMPVWSCLTVGVCVWFAATGSYTKRRRLQDAMKRIIGALLVVLLIDGFVEFATKDQFSRVWIFLVWLIAAIMIPIARYEVRRLLDAFGCWRLGAVALGSGTYRDSLKHVLERDFYVGYSLRGYCGAFPDTDRPLSVLAAKLIGDMHRYQAHTVVLVPSEQEMSQVGRIADALNLNLIPYLLIPPIARLPLSGLTIQSALHSDAILMSSTSGLMSPLRRAAKRVFDLVFGAALLLLLSPLYLLVAVLISVNGGSPIYSHERVGRGGHPFGCLKFRTMRNGADKMLADLVARDPEVARQWHENYKIENDPRITPIGHLLRKSSLDELPQLINVIRGEMSLVGPRPVVAEELAKYYGEDALYYRLVRPGITGLWQVSGRSKTSYDERVFLDSWYVRNWSLWTDFVILFKTLPSVLGRDGAC